MGFKVRAVEAMRLKPRYAAIWVHRCTAISISKNEIWLIRLIWLSISQLLERRLLMYNPQRACFSYINLMDGLAS